MDVKRPRRVCHQQQTDDQRSFIALGVQLCIKRLIRVMHRVVRVHGRWLRIALIYRQPINNTACPRSNRVARRTLRCTPPVRYARV